MLVCVCVCPDATLLCRRAHAPISHSGKATRLLLTSSLSPNVCLREKTNRRLNMKQQNPSISKLNFQIFLVETLRSQAGGRTSRLSASGMCCCDSVKPLVQTALSLFFWCFCFSAEFYYKLFGLFSFFKTKLSISFY